MVNSCTGKMGHATAEAVVRAGLELVPYTFTGYSAGVAVHNIGIAGIPVELVGPDKRQQMMDIIKSKYPNLVIIDFTLPYTVADNAVFYARNGVPFVLGTTGGDRSAMMAEVEASGVYAVIAPQMGKQVVAVQAMVEWMADAFPGAFQGYDMTIVESHQTSKADTSGTARALVPCFQKLGVDIQENQIRKIRDPMTQLEVLGVPEKALTGHAFHTYTLTSPDGSVNFVLKHNVVARGIYAEGTVDAVLFLHRMKQQGAQKRIYNMVDVLKEGMLR